MNRVIVILLGGFLLWQTHALAQETEYTLACNKECSFLTKSCTAYTECSIAKSQCLESCMQRKVWEKMAVAVDRLTDVLEKKAQEKEEESGHEGYSSQPVTSAQNTTEAAPYTPASMYPDMNTGQ